MSPHAVEPCTSTVVADACLPAVGGDNPSKLTDMELAARQLRTMVSRKTTVSVDRVLAFLDALDPTMVSQVLNGANNNGKAPIHYAAQLRAKDGAQLCAAILERRAEVDATTRRGHTALLFAAGRGHSDIVRLLLAAGANPRIVSACGEKAATCPGAVHLDAECRKLLLQFEAADTRKWQDFRLDEDANAAQVEYERMSLNVCARRMALKADAVDADVDGVLGGEPVTVEEDLESIRMRLIQAVVQALTERSDEKLTDSLVRAALTDKLAARSVLRMVLSGDHASSAVCPLLSACRNEAFERSLEAQGHRRRVLVVVVRVLVHALVHELRNSTAACGVPAWEIAEAAGEDAPLAMEALLVKPDLGPQDQAVVADVWSRSVSMMHKRNAHISELAWAIIGSRQCNGRQREFAACRDWALFLHWAAGVRAAVPSWLDMVDDVVQLATRARQGTQLLVILDDLVLPGEACDRVREGVSKGKHVDQTPSKKTPSPLPPYNISVPFEWVDDAEGIGRIRTALEAMILELPCRECLCIGMDTEWGDSAGSSGVPSVVQIAMKTRAWVVDALRDGPALGILLSFIITSPFVRLFGFAFDRDAVRLTGLVGDTLPASDAVKAIEDKVEDLQIVAMRRAPLAASSGAKPGLKTITEMWLGFTLDKRLQCSDWDARPLTDSQLEYAAADAAVLLDIAASLGVHGSQVHQADHRLERRV